MSRFFEALENRNMPSVTPSSVGPGPLLPNQLPDESLDVSDLARARSTRLRVLTPNPSAFPGQAVQVRVALRSDGVNLPGRRIKFYDDEDNFIGSAITDVNGEAAIAARVGVAGPQNVKAVFDGGSLYRSSHAFVTIQGLTPVRAFLSFRGVTVDRQPGQPTMLARFTWRVTDAAGKALPGVKVQIKSSSDQTFSVLGSTTGPDGTAYMVASILRSDYGKSVALVADLITPGYAAVGGPVSVVVRLL